MGLKSGENHKIVDAQVLDDDPTTYNSSWIYVGNAKKITFAISVTKTSTPTNVVFKIEHSPDNGTNTLDYDKLITDAGVDAPASTITYTDTGEDICSVSPEDNLDYVRVNFTGSGTTATKYFTCNCWLLTQE